MKSQFPCPNHLDSEGFFSCRYCGKGFCEVCCQKDFGFYHCLSPECTKAYLAESKGPKRRCPYCGKRTNRDFPVCRSCGEKILHVPEEDQNSLVTIAKFGVISQADLARTKLASEGILSFVADENSNTLYAAGNLFAGGVRLQVRFSDSKKALRILGHPEADPAPAFYPDEEPAGACHYCGAILSLAALQTDVGFPCCRKPECLKALKQERDRLKRFCPTCGAEAPYPTFFCTNCGRKLKHVSVDLEPVPPSKAPPVPRDKWGLGWAVMLWLFLFSIETLPDVIFEGIHFQKGELPNPISSRIIHYSSLFLCIGIILYWVKRAYSLSWLGSLKFLGYKTPNPRQMLAGFLILIPFLIGNFLSLQGYQREGVLILLQPKWQIHLIHILIGAGLFEETIYRGFLFQCLRRGRSFLSAACLSSGIWALSHISHLIPDGGKAEDFHGMMVLMLGVFIHGILGSFLFEKGGNNIWGWMLFHVGYDSCFLFNHKGGDFYVSFVPGDSYWSGFWFSMLLAVTIILWLFSEEKKTSKEKVPSNPMDNTVSLKWKPLLLPVVIASSVTAVLFLVPAKKLSDKAVENHWQSFIDAHPRYADGYRKWACDLYEKNNDPKTAAKCEQALDIDPNNADAWLLWGKVLGEMDQCEDSAKKFKKVTEFEPKRASAFLWWGHMLEKTDQKDEAVEKYRTVLLLNPDETYFIDYAKKQIDRIQKDENKH